MSFKLKISNQYGSFNLELLREVTQPEMFEICTFATNLLPYEKSVKTDPVYGPIPPPDYRESLNSNVSTSQTLFGERPTTEINLESYKEPESGVRIKILHMVRDSGRMSCIKVLRQTTGISLFGCKDILYGNYQCPILDPQKARVILEEFKRNDLNAKIVPASDEDSV